MSTQPKDISDIPRREYLKPTEKTVQGFLQSALEGDTQAIHYYLDLYGDKIVDAKDKDGHTAVYHALRRKEPVIFEALLQAGANIHQLNKFGDSLLRMAVSHDNAPCLEILLRAGACEEPNVRTGETLVMRAAQVNAVQCLPLLASAGFSVCARDFDGKDACYYARLYKFENMTLQLEHLVQQQQEREAAERAQLTHGGIVDPIRAQRLHMKPRGGRFS